MLSRAADERVFRGSQDVVIGGRSVGSRSSRHGRSHARQNELTMSSEHPVELVFFPNGEIRPRDECPAGMALPPPVTTRMIANHEHVYGDRQHDQQLSSSEHQRRYRSAKLTRPQQEARGAPSVRQGTGGTNTKTSADQAQRRPRQASRLRSSSISSSLSFSDEDHDESSSDRDGFASKSSYSDSGSEAGQQQQRDYQDQPHQRQPKPQRLVTARPALAVNHRGQASGGRPISTLRVRTASPERVSTKRAEVFDRVEEMNGTRKTTPKNVRMVPDARAKSPARAASVPRQSIPAESSSKSYEPARRVDASKIHVKPNGREPSRQKKSENSSDEENSERRTTRTRSIDSRTVKRLEQELMKERERVLAKMTQLLEEQGKTQQLREKIERHEAQMEEARKQMELKVKEANDEKEQLAKAVESKWRKSFKAIEDQLHVKDAAVLRLESEIEQLKVLSSKKASESNNQKREQETLAKQDLEDMIARMAAFHTQVERWKANSKEAMECCDRKADMLGLIDNMWMDFPRFSKIDMQHIQHQSQESRTQGSNNDATDAENENANMVQFLKKKLRVREDELRQMHVKYVELKELCAAQCIREADLQNFINEHRLRGNLTFNKEARNGDATDARKNVHFQEQQSQRNGTPAIVTRGTNTPSYAPAAYSDEEEDQNEVVDNQIESDDEDDYIVREPKVFVQVARDGVYEHTSHRSSSAVLKKLEEQERARKKKPQYVVERIRLVPSATLAERYERVPTPTNDYAPVPRRQTNRPSATSTSAARRALGAPPSSRQAGAVKKKTTTVPAAGRNSSRAATVSSRAAASLRPWA